MTHGWGVGLNCQERNGVGRQPHAQFSRQRGAPTGDMESAASSSRSNLGGHALIWTKPNPGVSLPHLRKRSEWVALSRPGPEHVGSQFGPRGPLWRAGGLPMTRRDQRAFAICLDGGDPGAQSCCPRSARDDGLTDPGNGPDAVRYARSPAPSTGVRSRAAMRFLCLEVRGGNSASSCAASTDKMVGMCGRW
jgi:hypothetical protein